MLYTSNSLMRVFVNYCIVHSLVKYLLIIESVLLVYCQMSKFSALSCWEQVTYDKIMMMMSALYSTSKLSWIFIWLAHSKLTVHGTCRSPLTHPDSELTNLCSYSLMLCSWQKSNKYQFYSLCFDLIRARTHNLPHLRQARLPLHHWCGLYYTRGEHANHYTTNAVQIIINTYMSTGISTTFSSC